MYLKKIKHTFLYLICYSLLWIAYKNFVIVIGFAGFNWNPNTFKIIESMFLVFFLSLVLPSNINKPSDFFIHVHFLLPIIPMFVLYGGQDFSRLYIYFIAASFLLVNYVRKFNLPNFNDGLFNLNRVLKTLLVIVVIHILSIVYQGGLQYLNFNLLKVYDFRSLASENLPGIYAYLSPLTSKVILPFIIIISTYKKNWTYLTLGFIGSIMMFALTNNKGPLFYPILVFVIYAIMNKSQYKLIPLLIIAYIFSIVIPLSIYLLDNSLFLPGAFTFRRVYLAPALLNFYYYDYFSTHPHILLAESKLTFGLIDYPYSLNSSRIIAYLYTKGSLTTGGANTGWLGSSYMNFGFSGMLIYAFIIGLILSIVDAFAQKKGLALIGSIIFIPLFILFISADLPTAMLNHGILLTLLLSWLSKFELNESY